MMHMDTNLTDMLTSNHPDLFDIPPATPEMEADALLTAAEAFLLDNPDALYVRYLADYLKGDTANG